MVFRTRLVEERGRLVAIVEPGLLSDEGSSLSIVVIQRLCLKVVDYSLGAKPHRSVELGPLFLTWQAVVTTKLSRDRVQNITISFAIPSTNQPKGPKLARAPSHITHFQVIIVPRAIFVEKPSGKIGESGPGG